MIDRINPNQIQTLEQPKSQETKTGSGFGQILDQALAGVEQTGSTGSSLPLTALGSVSGLVLSPTIDQLSPVDETLGLLDKLSANLLDPATTARGMESLVQALDAQADKLTSAAEKMPAGSPERKIMDEAAVVAKVQVAKYNRGDFS